MRISSGVEELLLGVPGLEVNAGIEGFQYESTVQVTMYHEH